MVEGAAVFLHCEDRELLEVAKAVLRDRFPQVAAGPQLTILWRESRDSPAERGIAPGE